MGTNTTSCHHSNLIRDKLDCVGVLEHMPHAHGVLNMSHVHGVLNMSHVYGVLNMSHVYGVLNMSICMVS